MIQAIIAIISRPGLKLADEQNEIKQNFTEQNYGKMMMKIIDNFNNIPLHQCFSVDSKDINL